jgi:hypothetical protein
MHDKHNKTSARTVYELLQGGHVALQIACIDFLVIRSGPRLRQAVIDKAEEEREEGGQRSREVSAKQVHSRSLG